MSSAVRLPKRPETTSGSSETEKSFASVTSVRGILRGHLVRSLLRLSVLLTVDLAVISLLRLTLRALHSGMLGGPIALFVADLLPMGAVSVAQLSVAVVSANLLLGCYRSGDRWSDPAHLLKGVGLGVFLALYSDLWHGGAGIVVGRGLLTWLALGPLLIVARGAASRVSRRWAKNTLSYRVLVILGDRVDGKGPSLGPSYQEASTIHYGDLPDDVEAMERLLAGGVDTVLVRGHLPSEFFGQVTDFALTHGCRLLCMPRNARGLGVKSTRVWLEGRPLTDLTAPGLRASQLVLKRALDIVVAASLIVVLSPLFAIVALWVKCDSEGQILFRQRRPGIRGEWFGMLKFRSMRHDAEVVLRADPELYEIFLQNDCKLLEEMDPRLTRSGRLIRKTSLDELPQLFNVLRGDMSLVGPRPLVGPELEKYGGRIPTLLSVRPGITGLWQVSGRSRVRYPARAEMDLDYVRNWSFLGDVWILLLTPFVVLIRRGAH